LSSGGAAPDVLIVLAGGQSRRFGRDKALADLGDGETLALRALRRLAPLAPRRVLVRAAPIAGLPADVVRVADPVPGRGPLQALRAAFAAVPGARCFVAPCDLPGITPDVYAPLAAAAGATGVACARRGEQLEPLVAVWSGAAAARLLREVRADVAGPVHRALAPLGATWIDFEVDDPRLRNVNFPQELAAFRAEARASRAASAANMRSDA
jgi:molybdopterin-guanine dinucleotide biosynthesis protein A